MSMVNCPECDGKVSTLAEVCPHCGYPLKPQKAQDEEYVLSRGSVRGKSICFYSESICLDYLDWRADRLYRRRQRSGSGSDFLYLWHRLRH